MQQKQTGKSFPRIGVFTAWFRGHYQLELISGIEEAARSLNAQVLYFSGRSLHSPRPFEADHNLVYDTALAAPLDGLIIFSILADYCSDRQLAEFIARYRHMPIVTINFRATAGRAILTNNKPGFTALMEHLTAGHGYKKIAFIGGPEQNLDAAERFALYCDQLTAHGIACDPALVAGGDFMYSSGQEAVRLFIDERRLVPGRDIEAIVCVNDSTACGVIDELAERGLAVPGALAVTGFDNMGVSVFPKPPLTTVKQQLQAMGSRAVQELLGGRTQGEPLFFDTELVIRNSCGCPQPEREVNINLRSPLQNRDLEFLFYENIGIIDNLKSLTKTGEFADWMKSSLPILGIGSAWLFLSAHDNYDCIAGYDLQEPAQVPGREITEDRLFTELLLPKHNRSFCLLPLLFQEEKYGLIMLEVKLAAILVYDALSHHIGSSLKNMRLVAEMAAMNQQLVEANEQKTQFFINVAHETKTPLTLISNYLELYRAEHPPDEKLLVIKENIGLLLQNMLNFLDAEKLKKGKTLYSHDALVDLAESARKKCALFRVVAAKKELRLMLNAEAGVVVRCDPWALDRIFNNLLDNAVKYTQAGGEVKVDVASREGGALLRVSDNGPGLPADTFEHIFEPYYLLSQKKSGVQGIGVGLSIVKRIVDELGAVITVARCRRHGTCFTITFPAAGAAGESLREIPATPPPSSLVQNTIKEKNITADKQALLIVDDNTQLLTFLQTAFAQSYNVFLARDGLEALCKIKTIPRPAVIISDIMMDGPDGFALLSGLSLLEGYADIPFIFLTALGGERERIHGLGLGAVDYIEKPFSLAELTAKIESLIALRKRQEKQDIAQFRTRLEGIFSELETNYKVPVKPDFPSLCVKYGLTAREQEIVRLLLGGLVHKEIASRLNIALRTLEYYITKIYKKCGVSNKFDLLSQFQGPSPPAKG